jgi:serine/threonine protein kinase
VKVIDKKFVAKINDYEKNMEKELQVIRKLKHRNIIDFIDMKPTKNNYYYVFEYCEGQELKELINEKGRLDEIEAQKLFKQLADAMVYLNQNDVVHRDLKPANIMVSKSGELKIIDFGLSRIFNKETEDLMTTVLGTPLYQAPEIINGIGFDEKTDLWSIGVILYQMVMGTLPFTAKTKDELKDKLKQAEYPRLPDIKLSEYCTNMIKSLIVVNPTERIEISKLKSHPFVKYTPEEYLNYLNKEFKEEKVEQLGENPAEEVKNYVNSSNSGEVYTVEDLQEAISDTKICVTLTLNRL